MLQPQPDFQKFAAELLVNLELEFPKGHEAPREYVIGYLKRIATLGYLRASIDHAVGNPFDPCPYGLEDLRV